MTAHSNRFRPTRAGIVNLWDYRDQEFSFADGRLVLRGPNGSGKTKALEVLFPFVLDGRIEPRRLNPFAGEERTMKSNLLYRGQESAHSYVWMEFGRGSREDPESVTVGIGMRASRHNDKVTRWYFVADGRVGVDFSLLGSDDRPLTKKQLAEQLGSDALTDRPVDYRDGVAIGHIFFYVHARFGQHLVLQALELVPLIGGHHGVVAMARHLLEDLPEGCVGVRGIFVPQRLGPCRLVKTSETVRADLWSPNRAPALFERSMRSACRFEPGAVAAERPSDRGFGANTCRDTSVDRAARMSAGVAGTCCRRATARSFAGLRASKRAARDRSSSTFTCIS